jgi:3-oxoacyl-[acyl-carrier protein] reductase
MKKTALITGGSRGIGAAVSEKLARSGYRVFINYHKSEQEALELAERLRQEGLEAEALCADVSDEESVRKMIAGILDKTGGIDVVVNNAGVSHYGMIQDVTDGEWDRVFDINVRGTFHVCREAVKAMYWKRSGRIVNVSSMWGISGASCESVYAASKAAVIGFTKSLAKELAPAGITLNCVAPGATETDMMKELPEETVELLKEETPLGRLAAPGEIAETIAFLASDAAGFMTGQVISPNGGLVI